MNGHEYLAASTDLQKREICQEALSRSVSLISALLNGIKTLEATHKETLMTLPRSYTQQHLLEAKLHAAHELEILKSDHKHNAEVIKALRTEICPLD